MAKMEETFVVVRREWECRHLVKPRVGTFLDNRRRRWIIRHTFSKDNLFQYPIIPVIDP